jgi:CBS domain containing-hemolysin-like protein
MTGWKILMIAALIAANAFFVSAEFSLVAIRRTRIKELVSHGSRRALGVQKAVSQLSLMLSGTQLGVTLTALGLGALGEPTLAHVIGSALDFLPDPFHAIASHSAAVVVAFVLITFFEVVIGEMVPKNLALSRPEGIALAVAAPLRGFVALLRPLIWLIERSSRVVLGWIGIHSVSVSSAHTPGEIALIVEESRRRGSLEPGQSELLARSLEFPERRAVEAMVPRVNVVAVPARARLEDVLDLAERTGYSRFPVWRERPDEYVGWLHIKDTLRAARRGPDVTAGDVMREALYVPESLPLDELLVQMQRNRTHLAVVLDEFGATSGIITLEDILEELVGEIRDESDVREGQGLRRVPGGFRVPGTMRPDEVEDATGLTLPEGEYETIAGYILEKLGRLARRGDELEADGWTLRVANVGRRRILSVDLRPPADAAAGVEDSPEPSPDQPSGRATGPGPG